MFKITWSNEDGTFSTDLIEDPPEKGTVEELEIIVTSSRQVIDVEEVVPEPETEFEYENPDGTWTQDGTDEENAAPDDTDVAPATARSKSKS